jgi:hypothetical protein
LFRHRFLSDLGTMELLHAITNTYERLMSQADSRVSAWPLMSSPLPTIAICTCYVLTVKVIGPRLMRDRPAFDMRIPMIAYNFFMVLVSATIVYLFSKHAWFNNYSFRCQPVDYTNSAQAHMVLKTSYLYFLVKFVEFIDTAFFVLRKKQTHISTLHVIHHGILPFSVWWGMKFVPGMSFHLYSHSMQFDHHWLLSSLSISVFVSHSSSSPSSSLIDSVDCEIGQDSCPTVDVQRCHWQRSNNRFHCVFRSITFITLCQLLRLSLSGQIRFLNPIDATRKCFSIQLEHHRPEVKSRIRSQQTTAAIGTF